MKKKDITIYLQDILDAIEHIEQYAIGGKKAFLSDHMKQDAIIRQLAIIGEAVKKLPISITRKCSEIPWKNIAGMRDILVHDYADIDVDMVWNVVKKELSPLKKVVFSLISSS